MKTLKQLHLALSALEAVRSFAHLQSPATTWARKNKAELHLNASSKKWRKVGKSKMNRVVAGDHKLIKLYKRLHGPIRKDKIEII